MVQIADLMDIGELSDMISRGYVHERQHPTLPLRILNYGAKTQHEWLWNDATRQCRGMVVAEGGRVVARPLQKFFSADQLNVAGVKVPTDEPFVAYEKMDGSLAILFHYDGEWHAASRGSFISDQARKAGEILARYADHPAGLQLDTRLTYLAEVVFPENRIVVDYKDLEDLFLLSAIETETGDEDQDAVGYAAFLHGFPLPRQYEFASYDEALYAMEDDERFKGKEGVVLRFESGLRIKLKTAEYQRQHRLVTRVTPKRIWEHLSEGRYINALTYGLWSEPAEWIKGHAERLESRYREIRAAAALDFNGAKEQLGQGFWDRGTFARWVGLHCPGTAYLLFAMYDGKDEDAIRAMIWKTLKPKGDDVYRPEAA